VIARPYSTHECRKVQNAQIESIIDTFNTTKSPPGAGTIPERSGPELAELTAKDLAAHKVLLASQSISSSDLITAEDKSEADKLKDEYLVKLSGLLGGSAEGGQPVSDSKCDAAFDLDVDPVELLEQERARLTIGPMEELEVPEEEMEQFREMAHGLPIPVMQKFEEIAEDGLINKEGLEEVLRYSCEEAWESFGKDMLESTVIEKLSLPDDRTTQSIKTQVIRDLKNVLIEVVVPPLTSLVITCLDRDVDGKISEQDIYKAIGGLAMPVMQGEILPALHTAFHILGADENGKLTGGSLAGQVAQVVSAVSKGGRRVVAVLVDLLKGRLGEEVSKRMFSFSCFVGGEKITKLTKSMFVKPQGWIWKDGPNGANSGKEFIKLMIPAVVIAIFVFKKPGNVRAYVTELVLEFEMVALEGGIPLQQATDVFLKKMEKSLVRFIDKHAPRVIEDMCRTVNQNYDATMLKQAFNRGIKILKAFMGGESARRIIHALMVLADFDNDGMVTSEDIENTFMGAGTESVEDFESGAALTFDVFDHKRNGYIEKAEVKLVMDEIVNIVEQLLLASFDLLDEISTDVLPPLMTFALSYFGNDSGATVEDFLEFKAHGPKHAR